MAEIIWHGHACFEVKTDTCSVVFDPFEENYVRGLKMPHLTADKVISSHLHRDHYAPDMVALTGNEPDMKLTQIPCFHDDAGGRKRGENLISVIEADGIRICHMGDIGHQLSREQLDAIGKVDILLIPVGGLFTVDANAAKKLCDEIMPATVVPMHYKGKGKGLIVIDSVDRFLSHFGKDDVRFLESNSVSCGEILKSKVAVFPWP